MRKLVFGIVLATLAPLALVASNKVDREFLDALLRTHSVTGDRKGIYQGVDLVRGWLEKRGVYCRTETNAVGLVGLYASVTRTHTPDYLFVSHIDVVPGPEFLFTPRVEGDRFFARGACDTKGNVVAICQTLANLVGTGASVGVVLATDEEGGRGATATAQMMIDKGYVGKKLVLVADTAGEEPGQLFTGEKGHICFKLVSKGRGGHSSRPWSADNPVPRLCEGYLKFKAAWDAQDRPEQGKWRTVISPTSLQGGAANNIIPDEAIMTLSCRFIVPEDKDRVEKMLAEASGLEVRAPKSWRAPVVNRPGEPEVYRLLKAMNASIPGGVKEGKMSAATDASFYTATGTPCVIFTANAGEPHSDREWGSFSSLDDYCTFFTTYFR